MLSTILSRKSVRTFTDKPVSQEQLDTLVRAGMAAPSGMDRRPWEIIIITDRPLLDKLANGLPFARMLAQAPCAIVVCGDSQKSEYWHVDCSAVAQNILLAAESLDLGAVWTAAYPYDKRMAVVSKHLSLPAYVLPLAVIPIGYPDGKTQPKNKYDATKVHHNTWKK